MAYNPKKEVFEILDEFEKQPNKSKRKELLLQHSDNNALRDVLRGTFDESLEWNLPEGRPPYTANIPESVPSTLLREHRQFGYFVKGAKGDPLPAYKRENMFIRLLESIHPADAEIVLSMVTKKSPVKFLTKKLVQEAFPNLITT
jgi:hypothetical protein